MSGRKEWFHDLNEAVKSQVRFADNSVISAEGVGKVMIKRKDGIQTCISDVLYVPNMKTNLLSLGQLVEKGYSMNLSNNQMKIYDGNDRLILKAPLSKIGLSKLAFRC